MSGNNRGKLKKWVLPKSFVAAELFSVSEVPPGITRGGHAHIYCTQLLIVIQGELELTTETDTEIATILMNQESPAVEIKPLTWATQKYLTDSTKLIVLCSHEYDEREYVRDYAKFKEILAEKR